MYQRDPASTSPKKNHLQPDDRPVPVRPQLLPRGQADRRRSTRPRSITASARRRSTGCKLANRQSQAHLALGLQALRRQGRPPTGIMKSIKERSVTDEELGMFWRDTGTVVLVVSAPRSRRRRMMIEAFDEVTNDAQGRRGLQGLAAQAEADAGLEDHQGHRRRGLRPAAARRQPADVRRAGGSARSASRRSSPRRSRPAPASTSRSSCAARSSRTMGQITVKKTDQGVSWGSVHWQYLEDIAQGDAARGHAAQAEEEALQADVSTKSGPVLAAGQGGRWRSATNSWCASCCARTATWSTST